MKTSLRGIGPVIKIRVNLKRPMGCVRKQNVKCFAGANREFLPVILATMLLAIKKLTASES